MSAIRVKTRVPESRQVVITLPPDTPVGDAELAVTVLPAKPPVAFTVELPPDNRPRVFPTRPTNPQLAAEFDAFERLLPELMREYAGKYVALHNGVVAVAASEVGALTAAHEQQPGRLVYARLVTDQPQPIERITTRRELSLGD
ncbi:MAG: hypothetical protein K2V38_01910 [Gemmataceae bacterium]|nr:hypothetical protein [Gemmataceae bacterium]